MAPDYDGLDRGPDSHHCYGALRIEAALQAAWPWPCRNTTALQHGDYWPGNILWRDGQLTAVVDWEDATIGDPLVDLAISRLDLLYIFGADAMRAFTRHYQSLIAVDDTSLPYWALFAALRLVRLASSDLANWAAGMVNQEARNL